MSKRKLLTLAVFSGIGFLPLVQAGDQPPDNRWYIAPFGTYVKPGGDRHSDIDGYGAGMGIGKMLNEHFN